MIDSDDRDEMRAYIEAADQYFRDLEHPHLLFAKPYFPLKQSGYNVARLGYLLAHLRHGPFQTVIDFGAGMCWLTIVLLRAGCKVIALDVSRAALELGQRAVAEAGLPEGTPEPQFLVYDGFTFPLDDNSIDRVACYDALHHVPNKRTVLREMLRVLRPGGRVCFVEPGPGHSASETAQHDTDEWGVLEDEIDASALCAMAHEVGFEQAYTVPLIDPMDNRLDAAAFRRLRLGERQQALRWTGNDALIVLVKDSGLIDSRTPQELRAEIEVLDFPTEVVAGDVITAELRVTNTGDTRWLPLPTTVDGTALDYEAAFLDKIIVPGIFRNEVPVGRYRQYIETHGLQGTVTLGARLWNLHGETPIDLDYARAFLPAALAPGESATVAMRLRAPRSPGLYSLAFDAVDEYITWFGSEGSRLEIEYLRVFGPAVPPDTRDPGKIAGVIELLEQPQPGVLIVAIENTGDTIWLRGPLRQGGFVQVGVQRCDASGQVVDRDWMRFPLPKTLMPGDQITMRLDIASNAIEDVPVVRVDLLSELRCWFSERGVEPLVVALPDWVPRG